MKASCILVTAMAVAPFATASAADGRPTVAVTAFTNQAASAAWFNGGIGQQLGDVLGNELSSTGDFNVVERQQVNAVLAEQSFARSGAVRSGTGPASGHVTGARYLVTGSVSAYTEDTAESNGGISFRGLHVGGGKTEAYVAIDVRVIDAETSQVVFSRTVEGRTSDHNINVGGDAGYGLSGDFNHKRNVPASKAVRAALVETTDYLDCVMVKRDGCEAAFRHKEQKRRNRDRHLLNLD